MASLCGHDVEVAAATIGTLDLRGEDPVEAIMGIAMLPAFERRGQPGSDHILAITRDKRMEELRRRLWSAQIEALYPDIEEERASIVDCLSYELTELVAAGDVHQFGKPVTSISEIELGTLVHLMSRGEDGERPLVVSSPRLRGRIFLLWKCRNLLAHRDVCTPSQVTSLLDHRESYG